MFCFAFLAFTVLIGPSFASPVGWADTGFRVDFRTTEYDNYRPWSSDYLRGCRWTGFPGARGPWCNDYLDSSDYLYNGAYPYSRGIDVSEEKYVRDYPYGEREVGVRDSVSVRSPGPWSLDYLRGSRWLGYPGARGPWCNDYLDWNYPISTASDYLYNGAYPYSRGIDVSEEKYVRDYPYGEREVGVRDSVSFRSHRPRPCLRRPCRPFDRYYPYAAGI